MYNGGGPGYLFDRLGLKNVVKAIKAVRDFVPCAARRHLFESDAARGVAALLLVVRSGGLCQA